VFTAMRAPRRALTGTAVSVIVSRAAQRAQIPGMTAHRLRHTAATDLLRGGASLPEVGQVLRHASLLSTAIYAKVDHTALSALARPWPAGAR
jgi:site-specific recombinase XerD